LGNLLLLMPLGIYLPLLYKKCSGLLQVSFCSLVISIVIELLQLATSYRSADIDDVLLNTLGASIGYLAFITLKPMFYPKHIPALGAYSRPA
jgi:glycopeptide antibiotics resistance protein